MPVNGYVVGEHQILQVLLDINVHNTLITIYGENMHAWMGSLV